MKTITYSLLAATLLVPSVATADSLADAFTNGKTSGQIRSFFIDRDRDGTHATSPLHRNAWAAGGYLKYETAELSGVTLGTAFYTTNSISDVKDADKNPTLFDDNKDSYSILGEAYLQYKAGNTAVKIGRQKLDTPLAGSDDARMLPNLFEAAVISNTDVENTTLIGAHVTRFAAGTFSNAYVSDLLAAHSGYGLNNISGRFVDMGEYAVGRNSAGVTAAAAIYNGIEGVTLQAWDYYAHDILNAVYLQGDVSWNCLISDMIKPTASVQYISESDIGDKFVGDVDSQYVGAQLAAGIGNTKLSVAYSQTGDSNDVTNGGIISPWGGMPAFTQGMVTRHQFFADTSATKAAGTYNLAGVGVNGSATVYYTEFDVGAKNAVTNSEFTAKESGFDIIYNPEAVKNLQLRLRANYARDFVPGLDWDEYRVIANYNF